MRLSRWYLWLIAVCVLAVIALLINAQLMMIAVPGLEVWISILAMTVGYALIGLGCAAPYENGRAPWLMRSGMIVGAIALVAWGVIIVTPELQVTMAPTRICTWLTIWPCLMALSGLLLLLPLNDGWRLMLRGTTVLLLALMGLYVGCAVWFYPDPASGAWNYQQRWEYEETAYRIGGGLAALVGGSLATTIVVGLAGVMTGRSAQPSTTPRQPYWLQCPRCGREQEALTGPYTCSSCNLRTRIELT
jgi:hypothetical protein